MIEKIANTIEMSFDIPESEKKEAQLAVDLFKKVVSILEHAKKHLNLMYDPFKDSENVFSEALYEFRGAIFRYKEQIKENFNKVKYAAFAAVMKLNYFSTDTHIMELINTFRDSINDIEKQVNVLLRTLDDLKSKEFRNNLISSIDSLRKACFEVEKLIKERIIDHINDNILAKDWISDTSEELKTEIKNRVPYITQLFEERQRVLEGFPQQ